MLEERAPARLILLRPLANAKNLPITALVHADRNQQRDVAHLARPAALEHDAVEINIRMVALDRTIAPGLDRPIDLLVEVRHRRRRHPRAPQCLRDVLDPAHRYPGQIHRDQGLLNRALAPPIPLDDRRLERLLAQLRYPQPYLAGFGLQAALVVPARVSEAWPAARSSLRSPAPCATAGEASRSSRSAGLVRQAPHRARRSCSPPTHAAHQYRRAANQPVGPRAEHSTSQAICRSQICA